MSGWGYFFLFLLLVAIVAPIGWITYTRIRASRAGLPPPPLSSYNPFSKSRSGADNPSSRIYPASRSPLDWLKDRLQSLRGNRSSSGGGGGGAYEPTTATSAGGRRGGVDPDEAWDSRVGAEADMYGAGGYYEEQELGLRPSAIATAGGGDGGAVGAGLGHGVLPSYGDKEHTPRGRSVSRDLRHAAHGGGYDDDDDDNDFGGAYVGGSKAGLDRRYEEAIERHHGPAEDPFGDGAERSELRGVSPRPVVAGSGGEEVGGLKAGGEKADSPTERRSMFRENV